MVLIADDVQGEGMVFKHNWAVSCQHVSKKTPKRQNAMAEEGAFIIMGTVLACLLTALTVDQSPKYDSTILGVSTSSGTQPSWSSS
jgi:hypothetical protein